MHQVLARIGDISLSKVDVIVNAANGAFSGGGGVDTSIHRAAGPELLAECRTLSAGRPGEVKLTGAYRLPSRFVAHAVGPVWSGGEKGEPEQLASCYRTAIELAANNGARSIAFPSISTGAYKYPVKIAAKIAIETVYSSLRSVREPIAVDFVLFSQSDYRVYQRILDQRDADRDIDISKP